MCAMAHKQELDALDWTLRVLRSHQILFGSSMVLLAGDFRQTLSDIHRSAAGDKINASLKASVLWRYVKNVKLTTNMRVALQNDSYVFLKALLDIGNGTIAVDPSTHFVPSKY